MSSMSSSPSSPSPPASSDNEAWNRLLLLEKAFNTLQLQNQQLLQQQQQAAAAAAHVNQTPLVTATTAGNASSRPKAPPMVTFNGMMGSTGFAVDHWLREVNKQFAHYPTAFPNDVAKIKFAVEWLTGPATDWWENEEKVYPTTHNGVALTSWDVFVERIRDRYRPRLPAELARQRLRTLVQKGRVESYCNLFLNLVAHIPDRNEEDKIFDFKTGLDRRLAAKVAEKQPATLQEAIEIAVQAEPYISINDNNRGGHGSNHSYSRGPSSFPRATNHGSGNSDVVPMDINAALLEYDSEEQSAPAKVLDVPSADSTSSNSFNLLVAKLESMENRIAAIGSSSRPPNKFVNNKPGFRREFIPGLTAADIASLQKEDRCFRCKQKGHMKNECPQNRLKY